MELFLDESGCAMKRRKEKQKEGPEGEDLSSTLYSAANWLLHMLLYLQIFSHL